MKYSDYTLRCYVRDLRCRSGERLVNQRDYENVSDRWINKELKTLARTLYPAPKYRLELNETWVTKTNIMTGQKFQERSDRPYFCSPSSETFWSM